MIHLLLMLGVSAAATGLEPGQDPPNSSAPVSYRQDILPILRGHCLGCHQPARSKGKLNMIDYPALMRGGRDGAVVVPFAPQESSLLQLIRPSDGEAPEMPVDSPPLSEEQCAQVERWILEGAVDDSRPSDHTLIHAEAPPIYPRPPILTSLDHSPNGELLAISGFHEVLVWKSDGSELAARLIGLSERIESIAFSPSGEYLAVAAGTPGLSGELQIWKVSNWKLTLSIPVTHDTIYGVSWSPDGSLVAIGASDRSLRAFDAKNGTQVLYQGAHTDWVLATTFSSDGTHLISAGRDRSLKLTKVATQQFIDNITSITPGVLTGGLMAVERHPERDELLVGGADGAPKVYRMYREKKRVIGDDYNLIRSFDGPGGRLFDVAWSPDGKAVGAVTSARDAGPGRGSARLYRAEDGEVLWTFEVGTSLYALDMHPSGKHVALGGADGQVRVLSLTDGSLIYEFSPLPPISIPTTTPESRTVEAPAPVSEDSESAAHTTGH